MDCRITEPSPFSARWYSHKTRTAGLRYEVGVAISTGSIVWAHGPFPCGTHTDLTIFRLKLKGMLDSKEKVVADCGYPDKQCVTPRVDDSRDMTALLARHETMNRRLKQFAVLSHVFRHDRSLHSHCFHAVCNLTQLMIENGEPLFNV